MGAAAGEVEGLLLGVAGLEFDGVGVEAVFEYVEVEGAEFGVEELIEQVVDAVEFKGVYALLIVNVERLSCILRYSIGIANLGG